MIVFFHLMCLFTRYIVNSLTISISKYKVKYKNASDHSKTVAVQPSFFAGNDFAQEARFEAGQIKFIPPVYIQRYEAVSVILKEEPWKSKIRKVVDFGCAELGFFLYLKNLSFIEEVLAVDIDEDLLQRFCTKAAPLNFDYLDKNRTKPLKVSVLAGSVTEYDEHLKDTDAVIAIELIEHLHADILEKLPYNIFHVIKPKLAIFTTPNADFNVLFPNPLSFRHDDHKFEWTRKEFFNWTQGVISEFPGYSVKFYGIGAGPEGTENLGCCSQMAVFERSPCIDEMASSAPANVKNYKTIRHYDYPFYVDTRTTEEKIVHEIRYRLMKVKNMSTYFDENESRIEVPFTDLFEYVNTWCSSFVELHDVLKKAGMTVEKKEDNFYVIYEDSVPTDSDEESWNNDDTEVPDQLGDGDNLTEEDWDLTPPTLKPNEQLCRWNALPDSSKSVNVYFQLKNSDASVIDSGRACDTLDRSSGFEGLETGLSSTPLRDENKPSEWSSEWDSGGFESPSLLELSLCMNLDNDSDALFSEDVNWSEESKNFSDLKANDAKRPQGSSKIPRKRQFAEIDKKCPPKLKSQLNSKHTVRPHSSYVRKSPRKISKSFSLDSCLENINCEPYEVQAFYLNLICNGNRSVYSLPAAGRINSSRLLLNDSGSPIVDSTSCEKAVDSGYPFSFSPHETDLTPEQVDELKTENEIAGSSTSEDSLSDDEEVLVREVERRNPHELFFEDLIVENGDLANNNRDGEGNNVEGLEGERVVIQNNILADLEVDPNDNVVMLLPEIEVPFPPWLLNLVELAQQQQQQPIIVPFQDEGLGDDSSSDGNSSGDFDIS